MAQPGHMKSSSDSYTSTSIKQVVEDMTQVGQPPSQALKRRFTYFLQSTEHVDAVYAAVIARCKESTTTPDVFLNATLLMRQYLSLYPPSVTMLYQILLFVLNPPADRSQVAVWRSIHHLQNAVMAHADTLTGQDAMRWRQLYEATDTARTSRGAKPESTGHHPAPSHVRRLSTRMMDFPLFRTTLLDGDECVNIKTILGSTWRTPGVVGKGREGRSYEALLQSVEEALKEKEGKKHGRMPRQKPLFQYHHYRDQQPLYLEKEELDRVLTTLTTIPGGIGLGAEDVEVAEKLMVKVFCDSYAGHIKKDSMEYVRLTTLLVLTQFREMLGSPYICVRRTAFNLAFNLGVHLNLLEKQNYFGERDTTRTNITVVSLELEWLVHEMLLQLVQGDEEDDSVWQHAMMCWLSLTCDPVTGLPPPRVLQEVDVRALRHFTTLPKVLGDESSLSTMVRLIHDALVGTSSPPRLDTAKLELAGGWRFLVELFVSVHSWSARWRCFRLICLHIAEQLLALNELRGVVPQDQELQVIDQVLTEMMRHDVHWYISMVFKYTTDFHKQLSALLTGDGTSRDALNENPARSVLGLIMVHLQGLAVEWNRLPRSIADDIRGVRESESRMTMSIRQLTNLASSSGECRATNVENRSLASRWLFALMKHCAEHPVPQAGSSLARLKCQVEGVLNGVASDRQSATRFVFLEVTERYLLLMKSRESENHPQIADTLSRHLKVLVQRKETNQQILLKMLHLILWLLCSISKNIPQGAWPPPPESDTLCAMFLNGLLEVSVGQVLRIKTSVLVHIFNTLPRTDVNPYVVQARHAALVLLVIQTTYNPAKLADMGGTTFFQDILHKETSAHISLTAATFLCNHLSSTQGSQWRSALASLRDSREEATLANPYLLALHFLQRASRSATPHKAQHYDPSR